ncbi:MAG: DUF4325 domain-containing protein [Nitrospirota bacterium]
MKRKTEEIRRLILEKIDDLGRVSQTEVAKTFGITRQAVFKNLKELVKIGVVQKTESELHPYRLVPLSETQVTVPVGPDTQEDRIWKESVAPLLADQKVNIRGICQYGFTEMFNNVIDHSESQTADVRITTDALVVRMVIQDYGIGIWKKLQQAFQLDDPRHALLELTKGKLTTDPKRHTGEGIFFTSRMFDKFILASDKLTFCRFHEGNEWLFDVKEEETGPGTRVTMVLYLDSNKTTKEVFDKFTADLDDFGFSRTHLSVQLAKYEGDHLVSRSQAKRILNRLEKFKEVYLDFKDVTEIGQAFADEIFRVFTNDHPAVKFVPVNVTPDVSKMIQRARAHQGQNDLPI